MTETGIELTGIFLCNRPVRIPLPEPKKESDYFTFFFYDYFA
jgi:hypothetical protein